MDDKVYQQEIIQANPFPSEVLQPAISSSPSNVGDNYSPTVSKDNVFPIKKSAFELLSTALNTRSKKILQEFNLQDSGGFKIGDFKEGISGDLRITPNGLTARNQAGLTTFDIDGDTGDAIFAGELRAKDFVIADENGLLSLSNFDSDFYYDDTSISTSSTSMTDVAGSSLSFTLKRDTNVLISYCAVVNTGGTNASTTYRTDVQVAIDGVGMSPLGSAGWYETTAIVFIKTDTISCARIVRLGAGSHTIKLQWSSTGATGSSNEMLTRNLSYMILGR